MVGSALMLAFALACIQWICSGQRLDEDGAGLGHRMLVADSIMTSTSFTYLSTLELHYDPPIGTSSPTALGVFFWSNLDGVKFYYETDEVDVPVPAEITLDSSYASSTQPYVALETLFKGSRNRTLSVVGVWIDENGRSWRTDQHTLKYFVEASARPFSYGYLVPGIESSGYFLQVTLEVKGSARAQAAGSQEFSDFFTNLGIGTYATQIQALPLLGIDADLQGFEGGFAFNTSSGEHFGLLIPYHNGQDFFGKVVAINLRNMTNAASCALSYAIESIDAHGRWTVNGTAAPGKACVHVLDLASVNPDARGFRRGFLGFPYGYLAAGTFQTLVRLDLDHFGLNSTRFIDLSLIDSTFGGYSGGFTDGDWACFNPFRSYAGAVGGIRSTLLVDGNNLRPYYSSIMFCANNSAWQTAGNLTVAPHPSTLRTMDFSQIDLTLRGFADAIRVGRYVYLVPLSPADNTYSSYLLRINLGKRGVSESIDAALALTGNVRTIVDILDLAKVNSNLAGYSAAFSSGYYLFLVPFRNAYQPQNGQRGHGFLTRLNMNDFTFSGVDFLEMTATTRNQIPSFSDTNLRGYSYGFASGQYGLLVPFYNADFSGKLARVSATAADISANLQELDLTVDRDRPKVYKGYRGGFPSLWQGVES